MSCSVYFLSLSRVNLRKKNGMENAEPMICFFKSNPYSFLLAFSQVFALLVLHQ
jgi:hypothetical protein